LERLKTPTFYLAMQAFAACWFERLSGGGCAVGGVTLKEASLIETALKRDRIVVITALVLVIILSWSYVLNGAGMNMSAFEMSSWSMAIGPSGQDQMSMQPDTGGTSVTEKLAFNEMSSSSGAMADVMAAMATPTAWTIDYAILLFFMWWIMMVAMMLPSAAPMILLYAFVNRRTKARVGQPSGPWPTVAFVFGYLLIWGGFSAIATSLQWSFEQFGVLSPMMLNSTSAMFAGAILLFAGAYQLTPIKQACLKHCRGPLEFLIFRWRPGAGGALRMGVHHGAYCLGCCWGLMAILFFGGIMNLYWIIGLALIVLVEKVLPIGPKLAGFTGAIFIVWGSSFLYEALA